MWAALYVIGLLCIANGDSVAARDPKRFWLVLLGYPITALPGVVNSLLKRL